MERSEIDIANQDSYLKTYLRVLCPFIEKNGRE